MDEMTTTQNPLDDSFLQKKVYTVSINFFHFPAIVQIVLGFALLVQCVVGTALSIRFLQKNDKLSTTCKCWLSAVLVWSPIVTVILIVPYPILLTYRYYSWSSFLWNFIMLVDYGFLFCLSGYTIWLLPQPTSETTSWFGGSTVRNIFPLLACVVLSAIIGGIIALLVHFRITNTAFLNQIGFVPLSAILVVVLVQYNVKRIRSTSILDAFPQKYLLTVAVCWCVMLRMASNLLATFSVWSSIHIDNAWVWQFRWLFMVTVTNFLQFLGCYKKNPNAEPGIVVQPNVTYQTLAHADTYADTKHVTA